MVTSGLIAAYWPWVLGVLLSLLGGWLANKVIVALGARIEKALATFLIGHRLFAQFVVEPLLHRAELSDALNSGGEKAAWVLQELSQIPVIGKYPEFLKAVIQATFNEVKAELPTLETDLAAGGVEADKLTSGAGAAPLPPTPAAPLPATATAAPQP